MRKLPGITTPAWTWGVDVSVANGPLDEAKVQQLVAAGCSFAWVKASDGATGRDPNFERNWNALAAVGLPFGTYYVFEPSADPQREADNLAAMLDPVPLDLASALDFELAKGLPASVVLSKARQLADLVDAALTEESLLYCGKFFLEGLEQLAGAKAGAAEGSPAALAWADVEALSKRRLWVADYGRLSTAGVDPRAVDPRTGQPYRPRVPAPYAADGWTLWQSMGDGGCCLPWSPGTAVDVDWFQGSADEAYVRLAALAPTAP